MSHTSYRWSSHMIIVIHFVKRCLSSVKWRASSISRNKYVFTQNIYHFKNCCINIYVEIFLGAVISLKHFQIYWLIFLLALRSQSETFALHHQTLISRYHMTVVHAHDDVIEWRHKQTCDISIRRSKCRLDHISDNDLLIDAPRGD